MALTIDSTLQDLLDESHDANICLKMKEVAVGHGIPLEVPLRVVCTNVAFIVRPSMILYVNDRTKEV